MTHKAVELLSSYIKLDTTNPPGNEYLGVEFFSHILESHSIPFKTYQSKPGRASIRAAIEGSGRKKPLIMLHHMDVVPANGDEWSFDPFGGEIMHGYICGRGTLDTKSLGIIQLLALLEIKKRSVKLDRDLIFLATADEESGGDCGVEYLLREHADDFQAGLVLNEGGYLVKDPSSNSLLAMISPGEKGPCWLKLSRKGMPGHGSTPHSQNCLEKMTRAVNRLLNYEAPANVTPIAAEYFKKIAQSWELLKPYAADGRADTLLKILEDNGLLALPQISAMLRNTISLNMLKSGDRVNVIPSCAEALIDTRLLPGQDLHEWLNFVKSQLADDQIQIDIVLGNEGNASDMYTESYNIIEKALIDHYPDSVVAPYLMTGTTDSRFFREKNMPAYGLCPVEVLMDDLKSIHGIDEKVSVASFIKGTEVYTDIIRRLCS
ncbi:MAG: M20/M25/M40 family metallo-hydrolase [Dehalococcoidia bacterium]|jgi:acetylornithine deacetylase/succinyl-diaminopimelate desuccinylase-like protein